MRHNDPIEPGSAAFNDNVEAVWAHMIRTFGSMANVMTAGEVLLAMTLARGEAGRPLDVKHISMIAGHLAEMVARLRRTEERLDAQDGGGRDPLCCEACDTQLPQEKIWPHRVSRAVCKTLNMEPIYLCKDCGEAMARATLEAVHGTMQ